MMKKFTIAFIFVLIGILFTNFVQTKPVFAVDCLALSSFSSESDKAICRAELSQIEAQLEELIKKQNEQKAHTGTLQGDIDYLNSQIKALQTKVKARALTISQLKVGINNKVKVINTLSEKIKREHESLAQLLRNTNDYDNTDLVYLIFSDNTLSSFYSDLESYTTLKQAVKDSIDEINGIKKTTESEKKDLEDKQDAETNAKVELENAQKKVSQSEAEKKKLLSISKSKEAEYQKLAAEKKAQADKIRSALFPLRDAEAIPFGVAYEYALEAEQKTGVRPAFVLAILKQETNLGANVGSCIITDLTTGATQGKNSGKVFENGIHPTRDLPLLQDIVSELGRNPLTTVVSCPLAGVAGYGGAMGPAQFIPSTWNLIKSQIAKAVGKSIPDPWNPKDAIFASSILLAGNGADKGTYTAERDAACRYYSGRSCSDPKVKNAFYGNSVMALAKAIQDDIDLLSP